MTGHQAQKAAGSNVPLAVATIDAPIEVPSGQQVVLQDVIWNEPGPEGLTIRFRFVAPQIARDLGDIDFDAAVKDMAHLCQIYALPRVLGNTPMPSQIIISMADQAVEFGSATPDATQFFEAYSLDGDACIWEAF
jgi:hypothetical protein